MTTYWIISFRDRQGVVLSHRKEEVDDLIELGGVVEATLETDTPSVAHIAFDAWISTYSRKRVGQ